MTERVDLPDPDSVLGGQDDLIRRVLQNREALIAAEAVMGGDYWAPLIPGPLQTAAYARAVWNRAGVLTALINEAVSVNERRAQVLRTHQVPRRFLLTRQSLTTDHPLDPVQLRHQFAYLAELSAYEHVQVRVVSEKAHSFPYTLRGEAVSVEMVGGEVPFPLVPRGRFEAHFARMWARSEPYSHFNDFNT